jgi:ankyrin repeat protein
MYAAQYGNIDGAAALIASQADTMKMDDYGRSALELAKSYGHENIANLLVRNMQ